MDETPEELEQIRREAEAIDPYQYRRRQRLIAAVALGALGAAAVWGLLELTDRRRNPCERLRDHFCQRSAPAPECASYRGLFEESVKDPNGNMRSFIREQCQTKIRRLAEEDRIKVR